MEQVFLLEDSETTRMLIKKALEGACLMTSAATIKSAKEILRKKPFSLLILDLGLPDGDGIALLAEIRASGKQPNVPVFFLTSNKNIKEKITAFSLGADDYILKPFEPLELKARVLARLKNQSAVEERASVVDKGDLHLDLTCQRVHQKKNGELIPIDLTPREFTLLSFLVKHEEHVLSRDAILSAVWGDAISVSDRAVDTHLCNLRKKLQATEFGIDPVQGSGYRFTRTG